MPKLFNCPIKDTQKLSESVFRFIVHCPQIVGEVQPGQFLNIRLSEGFEPLWRRPLSIHAVDRKLGLVSILFEVVGKGTTILAQKQPGENLNILAPLGNCFPDPDKNSEPVLIAGGLGIAPLYFLAEKLHLNGFNPKVFIGARTKNAIYCAEDLRKYDLDVQIATEDGSNGQKGLVTEIFENYLRVNGKKNQRIFSCGPMPMLKAVAKICAKNNLPGYVSLEILMACGFGACVGCAVATHQKQDNTNKYKLVCKDGPVFDITEVDFDS